MEIYVITSGEYSDYRVLGASLDRALAEQIAKRLSSSGNWSSYEVEAFPLFDAMPEIADELTIHVEDVESGQPYETITSHLVDSDYHPRPVHHYVAATFGDPPTVSVNVVGADHERVRKTFSEQIAQAKADAPILIAARLAHQAKLKGKYGPMRDSNWVTTIAIPTALSLLQDPQP